MGRFYAQALVAAVPLPRAVQQMIIISLPGLVPDLVTADALEPDLRLALAETGTPETVAALVEKGRLDPVVTATIVVRTDLPCHVLDEAAAWYAENTPDLPDGWAEWAADARLGRTATALLARADVATATKARLVAHADYDNGLGWLLTDDGAAATDEQAWACLANRPGSFGVDLVINLGGRLLQARPALLDRALRTLADIDHNMRPHEWQARYSYLLLSAAAIPLTADQQRTLVEICARQCTGLETMQRALRSLLCAPWCTVEPVVLAREEYLEVRPRSLTNAYLWEPLDGTPLRELRGFWVRRWLFKHPVWRGLDSGYFVDQELAANPRLSDRQRRNVEQALAQSNSDWSTRPEAFQPLPDQPAERSGKRQPVWPRGQTLPDADRRFDEPRLPASNVYWYLYHHLGDNVDAWEVALTFLYNNEFTGTLRELVTAAALLAR